MYMYIIITITKTLFSFSKALWLLVNETILNYKSIIITIYN